MAKQAHARCSSIVALGLLALLASPEHSRAQALTGARATRESDTRVAALQSQMKTRKSSEPPKMRSRLSSRVIRERQLSYLVTRIRSSRQVRS